MEQILKIMLCLSSFDIQNCTYLNMHTCICMCEGLAKIFQQFLFEFNYKKKALQNELENTEIATQNIRVHLFIF